MRNDVTVVLLERQRTETSKTATVIYVIKVSWEICYCV